MNQTFIKCLLVALLFIPQGMYAKRVVAECTLEYSIQPDTSFQMNKSSTYWGTKKVFIKPDIWNIIIHYQSIWSIWYHNVCISNFV